MPPSSSSSSFSSRLSLILLLVVMQTDCGFAAAQDGSDCSPAGKMKRVVVRSFDAQDLLSGLAVEEVEIPSPAAEEVLVRMTVMPVHPADISSIMGVYPGFQPSSLPSVPGLEGAGEIVGVGPGVAKVWEEGGMDLQVGDRVVPYMFEKVAAGAGSWSEYVLVSCRDVVKIPEGVSDEDAAQAIVNPIAAVGMMESLGLSQADPSQAYILQSAGGSTLGKQLVQIAKLKGYKTISTVRRCEQKEELLALGADHVICTAEEDVAKRVMEITSNRGAWGAVDAVAGSMTATLTNAVRDGGSVLVYGALAGMSFEGSVVALLFRNVKVGGYWVSRWLQGMPAGERALQVASVLDMMKKGGVKPHTGRRFRLSEVKEAVSESNKPGRSSEGKVVLGMSEKCRRGEL